MDYPKRNKLRSEIDILIERLHILQEQEKSYEDISVKIEKKRDILKDLNNEDKTLSILIEDKKYSLLLISKKVQMSSGELKKIEVEKCKAKERISNERKSFIKQLDINDTHLGRLQKSISKHNVRLDELKRLTHMAEKDYEEYVAEIKNNKGDLFDKVTNGELTLIEQENKKNSLIKNIKDLDKEYKELDEHYQKLLENYIITQ